MKKRIYFADLTYNTSIVSSDYIPLGCGYVAAYANKLYGDKFDIKIFKYTDEFFKAVEASPPDIFAGSCYVWNRNLVLLACKFIKSEFPKCVTVLGGPAFPLDTKRQKLFFSDNPYVDFFIPYDGEIAFGNFLKQYLVLGDKIKSDTEAIDGCLYLDKNNQIVSGRKIERPRDLDIFISPYLIGLFDCFLEDRKFSPMMQTTRGCPFTCSYCWASNEQNRHISFFSYERVKDELYYITKMAKKNNIFDLVFCDSNFGLYEKDKKIIDAVYELQQQFNYPLLFFPNYGNGNRAELVKNFSKLRGVTYCFSTQSTDPQILKNVKRRKPDLNKLSEYVEAVHEIGKCTSSEIITGMPYETRETHMKTIRDLLDCGFDFIDPFTFMLLDGIELDSEEANQKFKYDIRYRLIPRNFGKIKEEYSFEIERVAVGTNTYSFDDYMYFRTFHYLLRLLTNNNIYRELVFYIKQNGVHLLDWILFVFDDLKNNHSIASEHFQEYLNEARSELRDSPEELKLYYSKLENYKKLIAGELGENLMQKYSVIGFSVYFKDYTNYFFEKARRYLFAEYPQKKDEILKELECIEKFTNAKLSDMFSVEDISKAKSFYSEYDIGGWIKEDFIKPLSAYRLSKPVLIELELSDEQTKLIKDIFKRYNIKENDLHGLYKATAVIHVNNYFRTLKRAHSDGLNRRKLKKLQQYAFLQFHLRPKILWKNIREVQSMRHLGYLSKGFFNWLVRHKF